MFFQSEGWWQAGEIVISKNRKISARYFHNFILFAKFSCKAALERSIISFMAKRLLVANRIFEVKKLC